jgi:hypothetical protein
MQTANVVANLDFAGGSGTHTVLSVLAGEHSIGGGILQYCDMREATILRLVCPEFLEAVKEFPWVDAKTEIKGSVKKWRAIFPYAQAVNVSNRNDIIDADFVHIRGDARARVHTVIMPRCGRVTDAAFEHLDGRLTLLDVRCCARLSAQAIALLHPVEADMRGCSFSKNVYAAALLEVHPDLVGDDSEALDCCSFGDHLCQRCQARFVPISRQASQCGRSLFDRDSTESCMGFTDGRNEDELVEICDECVRVHGCHRCNVIECPSCEFYENVDVGRDYNPRVGYCVKRCWECKQRVCTPTYWSLNACGYVCSECEHHYCFDCDPRVNLVCEPCEEKAFDNAEHYEDMNVAVCSACRDSGLTCAVKLCLD